MHIDDLDTPFLLVHLDALEENLDRAQAYCDEHHVGLRPHIKTHKCLAISRMQMDRGAMGIVCQKLGEAEVMVDGGVDRDVLIPYNIVGRIKLERLAALAPRTRLTVAADSEYTARGLSEAMTASGTRVGVVVEVDQGRTGVGTPAAIADMAALIDSLPGLDLRGIMIMPSPPSCRPLLQAVLSGLDARGLPHPIVSGGASPCMWTAHEVPELTEHRAGEYPVGGMKHLQVGTHTVEQCAGRVLTTVVSRPGADRAILDAGGKSLSLAVHHDERGGLLGHVVEYPEARLSGASEEHGHLDVSRCDPKPRIGERLEIIPVHPCPTFNEHDEIAAVRGDRVEAVWPVEARGRIR